MNKDRIESTEEGVVVEYPEKQETVVETRQPAPRRKRQKYQVVKVVSVGHGNALLEWETDGLVERCYLPLAVVEHAQVGKHISVEEDELAKGAPFGDDLTPYLVVTVPTPAKIQNLLRRRGVWRRRDVLQQSSVVRSALQALYQLDVVSVQGRVKEAMAREGG